MPGVGLGFGRYLNEYLFYLAQANFRYKELRYNSPIDNSSQRIPAVFSTLDFSLYGKAWIFFLGGGITGSAMIINSGNSFIDRKQIYGAGFNYGGGLLLNRHDFSRPLTVGAMINKYDLSLYAKSNRIGRLSALCAKFFLIVRF